jgi:hypothetical protein
MKYFFIFILWPVTVMGSDVSGVKSCINLCTTGNPECFSMGPGFKPINAAIKTFLQSAEQTTITSTLLCENRFVVSENDTVLSEGVPCIFKPELQNASLTVPSKVYGHLVELDSFGNVIFFELGSSPLLYGGDINFPFLNGEIEFLLKVNSAGIFGLRGPDKKHCLSISIQ